MLCRCWTFPELWHVCIIVMPLVKLVCTIDSIDQSSTFQVSSGNLLAVLSRHYQKVNVIRFTDNGSHFISGGDDNLVIVWSIAR